MQFRITARKPAQIAIGRRRLVGQWREGDDLGAGRSPALHEMRIDERERRVARKRDALSRRRGPLCQWKWFQDFASFDLLVVVALLVRANSA